MPVFVFVHLPFIAASINCIMKSDDLSPWLCIPRKELRYEQNKKQYSMPLFLCLLTIFLISSAQTVFANKSGDWEYETYTEKGVTSANLVWYYRSAASVSVPSSIEGIKVRKLSDTFSGNITIAAVTIPDGVTALENTFFACSQLKKVDLPSSITFI